MKNVSFQLNTFHGDADIYVSRKHKFPNKGDYEKSSVRSSGISDLVYFDDVNVSSTYYIAIYSF